MKIEEDEPVSDDDEEEEDDFFTNDDDDQQNVDQMDKNMYAEAWGAKKLKTITICTFLTIYIAYLNLVIQLIHT